MRLFGVVNASPDSLHTESIVTDSHSAVARAEQLLANGADAIVGEARYSYNAETRTTEFGLSIGDEWQGQGIGSAMLSNLECRAAALGSFRLFGETFRNNEQMIGLARKAGYSFGAAPSDWRQVRFEKPLYRATDIPCESWKQAAMAGWLQDEAPLAAH